MPIETVAPTLHNLEPVATAGLAITLAYLALDRFRYRSVVETVAAKTRAEIGDAMERERVLDPWNELRWLCRDDAASHSPIGFLANSYNLFYRNSLDVRIIAAGCLVCFLTLSIGAGLEVGAVPFLDFLNKPRWLIACFWVCVVSAVLPIASIGFGRKCSSWGSSRCRHLKRQLESVMQRDAQQAKAVA